MCTGQTFSKITALLNIAHLVFSPIEGKEVHYLAPGRCLKVDLHSLRSRSEGCHDAWRIGLKPKGSRSDGDSVNQNPNELWWHLTCFLGSCFTNGVNSTYVHLTGPAFFPGFGEAGSYAILLLNFRVLDPSAASLFLILHIHHIVSSFCFFLTPVGYTRSQGHSHCGLRKAGLVSHPHTDSFHRCSARRYS